MKLSTLKPAKGSVRDNRRLGRGHGSGLGATSSRGNNGAKSRSGYSQKKGFEGGQMPLQRRVPKFGFNNINRVEYKAINLDALQLLVDKTNLTVIDLGVLQTNGLIAKSDMVKILGRGEIKSAIEVRVHAFSASAIVAIEKAGGKTSIDSKGSKSTEPVAVKKVVKAVKVSPKVEAPVVAVAPVEVVATSIVVEAAPIEVKVEATPVVEVAIVEAVVEAASVEEVVEAPAVVEETVVETTPKASKSPKADDLKLIEGIGPKIADLFINADIDTFAKLAETSVEQMKSILSSGGPRFASHDPSTWAEQAVLARDGKMAELQELQDRLNGGKVQ